ncbi:MAG: hypothetical protein HC927_01405 [Deltaproteobacteria bacterium]|nr:hypothetical protein [Deltaproteobacteria bacterium]
MLAELTELEHPDPVPEFVSLAAAAPWTLAELVTDPNGQTGALTAALLDVLVDLGHEAPTWDALVHRLRGDVFARTRGEAQWIAFTGPRERRLFTLARAPRQRSVGHTPDSDTTTWLRAGALQGVEVGDRWALVGRANTTNEAIVEHVLLDRARLRLLDPSPTPPVPSAAFVAGLARRETVSITDSEAACTALSTTLAESPWLRLDGAPTLAQARIEPGGDCTIHDIPLTNDPGAGLAPLRMTAGTDPAHIVELLEDRARTRRLLAALSAPPQWTSPIRWSWGTLEPLEPLPERGARLSADQRIWIRLDNPSRVPQHWYVQVIFIDPFGRAWLLDGANTDGIQLGRRGSERVGERPGRPPGLSLAWAASSGASKCALVFIAANRPLQLGHLARACPQASPASPVHGLESHEDRYNRDGEMLVRAWSSGRIEFDLFVKEP